MQHRLAVLESHLPQQPQRARPAASVKRVKVLEVSVTLQGKAVDLTFDDGSAYRFHAEWMKDSSPSLVGVDEYRNPPAMLFELPRTVADNAVPVDSGDSVRVTFREGAAEDFNAKWLRAMGPFVGKPLTKRTPPAERITNGTGMTAGPARKPWYSDVTIPEFDYQEVTSSLDSNTSFLEHTLFNPGVCIIHNVPPPVSFDELEIGKPTEGLARALVGRMNQHTNRTTRYSITHAKQTMAGEVEAESMQKSIDYDCRNKLPMHTDHSQFPGMPGYLQFMQNLQGSVTSYVTDGLAVAEHIKAHYPREYELLTTVPLTHSFRNKLYSKRGKYRDILATDDLGEVDPYEVVHTHPVIMLDADGRIERIAQSETKRGVCAVPYEIYDEYMAAYRRWATLIEDPKYVRTFRWPENSVVVCNNYRVLHGRADMDQGGERTLIVGYTGKGITDNRYRLLCQERAARDQGLKNIWMTRLPNQVLSRIVL